MFFTLCSLQAQQSMEHGALAEDKWDNLWWSGSRFCIYITSRFHKQLTSSSASLFPGPLVQQQHVMLSQYWHCFHATQSCCHAVIMLELMTMSPLLCSALISLDYWPAAAVLGHSTARTCNTVHYDTVIQTVTLKLTMISWRGAARWHVYHPLIIV